MIMITNLFDNIIILNKNITNKLAITAMAGKKKKKGSKKKKGALKEKKPEEEKKTLYEIPEYIDPKVWTPMVELTIKLATPPVEHLSIYFQN